MAKKYVVPLKDAVTGAKHFSLLVNTMKAGIKGGEHKHTDNEHCWYILSGTGTMYIEGQSYRIEPQMAVFAPANKMHRIDVDPDGDLTYVLVYAPPGPEQQLKEKGEHAFDDH
jgi:mannose-6-phosphate isomerase-like protein (cupin superfamily)